MISTILQSDWCCQHSSSAHGKKRDSPYVFFPPLPLPLRARSNYALGKIRKACETRDKVSTGYVYIGILDEARAHAYLSMCTCSQLTSCARAAKQHVTRICKGSILGLLGFHSLIATHTHTEQQLAEEDALAT